MQENRIKACVCTQTIVTLHRQKQGSREANDVGDETTTLKIEGIEKNLRDTQFEKDNTKEKVINKKR